MKGKTIPVIFFFTCMVVMMYGFWVPAWYEAFLIIFFSFCVAGMIYGLLNARLSDLFRVEDKKGEDKGKK